MPDGLPLVHCVVGVARQSTILVLHQSVADRVVDEGGAIRVGAEPSLTSQLVRRGVRPRRPLAFGVAHARLVTHFIALVPETGNRAIVGLEVRRRFQTVENKAQRR